MNDLISRLTQNVETGEPLMVVEHKMTLESLVGLGIVGLGLIVGYQLTKQ